jgi:hypothetical protein
MGDTSTPANDIVHAGLPGTAPMAPPDDLSESTSFLYLYRGAISLDSKLCPRFFHKHKQCNYHSVR